MKIIIYTQCEENYGAHDWDGTGSCPQYWKPKGGEVYVVRHVSERDAQRIEKNGIPTLSELLTVRNEGFREYINGWTLVQDDEKECEDWESPIYLTYNTIAKAWKASRRIVNDGHMRNGIVVKVERWSLLPGGEREMYMCYYQLENGKFVPTEDLADELAALYAPAL